MKRSSDRDTPPRSKRSRSSLGRYDDSSDERITPERIRRRSSRGRSPSPRGRYPSESSHRDDYGRSREVPDRAYPTYKVLCVSALHPKASDDVIKDTLYREYKKFGDLSIRISHDLDERVAYVCFRSSEDARDAKHSKPRVIIYDKVALVEAVYETNRSSSELYRRGPSRPRSISPEYDRYYHQRSRSPPPERHRPTERSYERSYGPPPGLPHREFRREGPPPPHHEFMRAPPVHHGPPHMPPGPPHHYGPPRHMIPGGFKPHPLFDKFDIKKDKFPNYLHHVSPEDDPLATRTLFAGNLEINISEEELRRIFGRYGIVEDIDIKRPPPGTGNAYAFVRFQNLDMAHRSKVELSGQYIGKFQCKIGFGKATPTTRIWIGGLGPWTSISQLEREFDRFGAIKKIDYVKGDTCAYILYDSIDAAQAAVKEMRGFPLGGPEHRLRADFADLARKCVAVWQGALILKNSLFPAKFHLTDGDTEIVESLMKDEEGKHHLRITQRLRLDQPKLEDVSKRISSSSSHAIFLGLSGSSASVSNDDASVQTRPLRNLVSYLKQKEAAGVISLLNKETEGTGVLYAFPPCAFSTELLKRTAPNLSEEGLKEDHLVIVVVRGGSA
uniref:Uncharacterized protein n=2 Tax=Timema TaxID=61471 RepID=A0A7R9CVH1_TIMPO|nr:unnamed protein product [Timema poppensis]